MVCKEEVLIWYKESTSCKRLDLMCTLLSMCLPFELRFLGTCLEELGKRDYSELREAETRANNVMELADATQCVSDKRTRRKLALYLSLLHSANHGCSNLLYKTLANFDVAEIQVLLSNSVLAHNSEENPLDELLLLYTMALNHPAFTYEQKSVFGSILMKLQEEEAKLSHLQKPPLVCMKQGMQQVIFPCAPSEAISGAVSQQFTTTMVSGKPMIVPTSNLPNTGDGSKNLTMQEIAPPYFHLAFPSSQGPHPSGQIMVCGIPPPGMAQQMPAPTTPSGAEYPCPQAPYVGSAPPPTMVGEMSCQPVMVPVSSIRPLPSTSNAEYASPYLSPVASPYSSPIASRSGSPGWGSAAAGTNTTSYKPGPAGPARYSGSSSSSSSSSGGGGGGNSHRTTRSHPRKQLLNGQPSLEEASGQATVEQMLKSEEQLRGMIANLSLPNGVCTAPDPRSRLGNKEDKRRWNNAPTAVPPNQMPGSAGSSQSESPSPPRSPHQEDSWDQGKEETRWEKLPGGQPSNVSQLPVARTPLPRTGPIYQGNRRPQEPKVGGCRRPPPAMSMPYTLYATSQGMQPLRASTGAIFQTQANYIGGAMFSAGMMPPPTSGPASFPPFTPNGITSPPPPQEMLYGVPPSSQQTSPPPYVQKYNSVKQTSSPPPPPPTQYMSFTPPFPPPPLSGGKKTCYNCGGPTHVGSECREPSIEEVMSRGQYRLGYGSPHAPLEAAPPPPPHSLGGNPGPGQQSTSK